MHDRLIELLDLADAIVATAVGSVDPAILDRAASSAQRIRDRIDYPEDIALVALVGGTGSGKSSLFNRLLGSEAANVGGIRPTTSTPLVSTPEEKRHLIDGYLESMGDLDRTTHRGLPWLALVDLPDTDSVEIDHRLQVTSLVPKVDAVLWVADVEKYRDDALHRGFIRPLAAYQSQFLFVLNQTDRVPRAEVPELINDFKSALVDDGILEPVVIAVAANPPLRPPQNIDTLRLALETVTGNSVLARALTDLQLAVESLTEAGAGSSVDFDRRWLEVRDEAAVAASNGDLIGAGRRLAAFFSRLAEELWGGGADAALELSAHIGEDLRAIARSLELPPQVDRSRPGRGRWRARTGGAPAPNSLAGSDQVARELDGLVSAGLRPFLRQRADCVAQLTSLSVALSQLRSEAGR
ncbi:MAG: 50S ribosome-binding GTPase [Acidimicrobiia bacterium]|nr:50S ribosome-binding GTPase [Acidimicrobiia bacterium]